MAKEIPPDEQRCTATSKTTGERCKNPAKPCQNVCHHHGGSSPQAEKAALDLLREAVDPLTQEKIDIARDARDQYMIAKEEFQELNKRKKAASPSDNDYDDICRQRQKAAEEMRRWLEKFDQMYEEIADRAGPAKVKRTELTGEGGGPIEEERVVKDDQVVQDFAEMFEEDEEDSSGEAD